MIRYQITEQDYLAAQALHWRAFRARRSLFWACMLTMAGLLAILCDLTMQAGSFTRFMSLYGWTFVVAALCIGLVILARVYMVPWSHRRRYRQQKNLHLQIDLEWDAEGYTASTERGTVKTPWSDLVRVRHDDKVLLMYLSDVMFVVVPKRAFADAAEFEDFRTLMPK